MPLRLIQIVLPLSEEQALMEFLSGISMRPLWSGHDSDSDEVLTSLLVQAYSVDDLLSGLHDHFPESQQLRLVVSEVVASIPRLEESDQAPAGSEEVELESEAASGTLVDAASGDASQSEGEEEKPARRVAIEEMEETAIGMVSNTRDFLVTVLLSVTVAAVGLIRDNTAVVIGAMVIAPLLGPNISLALGTTLGKWSLIRTSIVTNAAGLTVALIPAVILGALVTVDLTNVDEITMRTTVHPSDIVLALAAGVVAARALASGTPGALVGVMVAVALLPPLVVAGLLLGAGEFRPAFSAALLTSANVVSLNLAAIITFVLYRVRPRLYWESDRAQLLTRIAVGLWIGLLVLLGVILWIAEVRGVGPGLS
jgi:uncharacterized hydrophobic protein (TIGR00341 family)